MSDRPLWQDNYKSMNPVQLVAELERIAKNPHFFDDGIKRRACIASELALKWNRCNPETPIILMEAD
jgi:hypothetical protein